jgi:hypothetical protein
MLLLGSFCFRDPNTGLCCRCLAPPTIHECPHLSPVTAPPGTAAQLIAHFTYRTTANAALLESEYGSVIRTLLFFLLHHGRSVFSSSSSLRALSLDQQSFYTTTLPFLQVDSHATHDSPHKNTLKSLLPFSEISQNVLAQETRLRSEGVPQLPHPLS